MKAVLALVLLVAVCDATRVMMEGARPCVRERNCLWGDWKMGSRTPADQDLFLSFAIKHKNMDVVEDYINHPELHERWMTREEVRELTTDFAAQEVVISWMKAVGFTDISVHITGMVEGHIAAAQAEKALNTRFYSHSSAAWGKSIHRCYKYSLPAELAAVVQFVDNTVTFPQTLVGRPVVHEVSVNAANQTTPALLNSFYKISSNTVASTAATQSLFESLGQSYSPSDTQAFEKKYSIPTQVCDTVIGTNDPDACTEDANNCVEANLDVQYIIAVAQGSPTTYWYIDDDTYSDIFLEWIKELAAATTQPLVHSISYGGYESGNVASVVEYVDNELAVLGATGITVMVSSGDDGVAGSGARHSSLNCGFHPTYPGELPHVVSVGATMGPEYSGAEIACTSNAGGVITTGGGFSAVFTAPDYQKNLTASYVKSGPNMPPTTKFASTGRGYPDVAMMGHNYMICVGGSYYEVSGTSASSPVFAGLITLINGQRLKAGKKALGYVNPTLYNIFNTHGSTVFNDITVGENNCAASSLLGPTCCTYGFTATKGWDPVCGLGSVNYANLASYLVSA